MNDSISNMLTSIISLAALAVSFYVIFYNRRLDRTSWNERLASVYHKFSEGSIRNARTSVWIEVIPKWFDDKEYRCNMTYYSDHRIDPAAYEENVASTAERQEYLRNYDISYLIDFYAYIYKLLGEDEKALRDACNQYFYHWWRGFLLSYILLSQRMWDKNVRPRS